MSARDRRLRKRIPLGVIATALLAAAAALATPVSADIVPADQKLAQAVILRQTDLPPQFVVVLKGRQSSQPVEKGEPPCAFERRTGGSTGGYGVLYAHKTAGLIFVSRTRVYRTAAEAARIVGVDRREWQCLKRHGPLTTERDNGGVHQTVTMRASSEVKIPKYNADEVLARKLLGTRTDNGVAGKVTYVEVTARYGRMLVEFSITAPAPLAAADVAAILELLDRRYRTTTGCCKS